MTLMLSVRGLSKVVRTDDAYTNTATALDLLTHIHLISHSISLTIQSAQMQCCSVRIISLSVSQFGSSFFGSL